jgi:uncharacterized protein YqgC (DUF456 family)
LNKGGLFLRYRVEKIKIKTGIRKLLGIFLFFIGLLALITPFTPGSWLIFVGLEFLGFRMLFWEKIKSRFQKYSLVKKEK